MDGIREARTALRRGRSGEALVHLWNALEPARLAGDRSQLETIGGLAARIAAEGEEGEQAEAARLLDAVREAAAESQDLAAPAITGTASVGGEPVDDVGAFEPFEPGEPGGAAEAEPEAEEEPRRSGIPSIWTILVILFLIITIVRNIAEG